MKNLKFITQQMLMLIGMLGFLFNPINVLIISALLPLKDACNLLKTKVNALQAKIAQYRKLVNAITGAKNQARIDLAASAFPIMSSARAWCIKNGKLEMADTLKYTLKELKRMPYKDLISAALLAIQEIDPLLQQLATYGITTEAFTTLKTKHQALVDIMGARSQAAVRRHNLGVSIQADMEEIMDFFHNQLTPLVGNFATSSPDFYNDFEKNKRVGTPKIMHTRLIARCVSELGVPYFGLTVSVDSFTDPDTGKTYEAASAVTNDQGMAEVSAFFSAPRTVTISGPSVIAATFPAISFIRGRASEKEFVLQPSFNIPAPAQSTQKISAK